jgi:hypothetical protein
MCHNPEISALFFFIGVSVSAYVYNYSPSIRKTQIHFLLLFYSLMELLQTIQYYYVNKCDNIINRISTEIAYVLVILQPLLWNIFFYINSSKCEKYIFSTAIYLCLMWMAVNIFARLTYKVINKPQTQEHSVFASDKVCTRKDNSHLYWTWTSSHLYELNANFLTYTMLWFIPALSSSSQYWYALIVMLGGVIGAIFGYTNNIQEIYYTFTASWCFISVPIVLAVMAKIIYNNNIRL